MAIKVLDIVVYQGILEGMFEQRTPMRDQETPSKTDSKGESTHGSFFLQTTSGTASESESQTLHDGATGTSAKRPQELGEIQSSPRRDDISSTPAQAVEEDPLKDIIEYWLRRSDLFEPPRNDYFGD